MFSKLSVEQLSDLIPFFRSFPKFALFANAAKFEVEKRIPNHPCDFYSLKTQNAEYFFCFRHNLLPDTNKPILMIGSHGIGKDDDVTLGMQKMKSVEPDLHKIYLLMAFSDVSTPARNFVKKECNLVEYSHETCHNFIVPPPAYPQIQKNVDSISLPASFVLGSTRVSDAEVVNSTWKFASPEDILQQKEKILRLPTACIHHDGKPVAFEMIGLHGQLSHQYTFPEYRNRGFGAVIENSIVNKCIREGFVPVKSVELINKDVLRRSQEHPLWQVVADEQGNEMVLDYVALRPAA